MALKPLTPNYTQSDTLSSLTPTRQRILNVLLEAQKPLSAYEIVDLYNESVDKPIHAMSVYRILEFLKSVQLIAHLHSVNKFLAQKSDSENIGSSVYLYVTCQQCCGVKKLKLDPQEADGIQCQIHRLGYQLSSHSIEVPGLCDQCSSNTDSTVKES